MVRNVFRRFMQVAGIIDFKEAKDLVDCGIVYIGFPLHLDVHEEDITEDEAKLIIERLPNQARPVLITYLENANEIITLCKKIGTQIIQLHGTIKVKEIEKVRAAIEHIVIIKSLIVKEDNLKELKENVVIYSDYVDAFITDTFDPVNGASGATGKTHDWSISKKIVELSSLPVILAGGLDPNNVRKAIVEVRPAGVDSHTGVENAKGKKDMKLVQKFVSEANAGFDNLSTMKY